MRFGCALKFRTIDDPLVLIRLHVMQSTDKLYKRPMNNLTPGLELFEFFQSDFDIDELFKIL